MTSENLPDKAAEAGQERLSEQIARTGMFGTETTGDTSGYGGLRVRRAPVPSARARTAPTSTRSPTGWPTGWSGRGPGSTRRSSG